LKRFHFILLTVGLVWFAALSWLVRSGVIIRETRLGILSRFLDMLPTVVGSSIAYILLLGWIIVLGIALEPLVRKKAEQPTGRNKFKRKE
jgi:hypothetical protein